jgi:hypothetical protein
MKQICLILIVLSCGLLYCCSSSPKRTEFICIADVNKDSECRIVPCSEVSAICKTGKYRIMKNFVTGYAYIYSTDPLTDMKHCIEVSR